MENCTSCRKKKLKLNIPAELAIQSGWKVPADTVTAVDVYFQTKVLLADLNIDESSYKKEEDSHRPGFVEYINEEKGIRYYVNTNSGEVLRATYLPEAAYNYMRCRISEEADDGVADSHLVDRYSDFSSGTERKRLDKFGEVLIEVYNQSGVKAYIVAYPGADVNAAKARERAEEIKTYLTRTHQIKPENIVIVVGGHRKKTTIELWIRPTGYRAPEVSPAPNKTTQ